MSDTTMHEQLSFEFEQRKPIKGYPELHWTGKRPYKSTVYYPAQLKEVYGQEKNGWMNKIFWGDNLQVMSHLLKDYRGKIDLIYIDPPFDSKADYKKKIKLKGKEISNDQSSFEEKQYGDIWTNDEYLQFMYERIVLCKELLSASGVFILHCDWHRSAYLKILIDEVFGQSCFVNELVWRYETGGIPEKFFSQKHDTLFVYSKTADYYFDKKAASFPRNICQSCGNTLDKWNNLKKMIDENGRIYRTIKSNGKIYKYYDDEPVLLSDVWTDISHIQQKDPQRLDYPTQKPEKLLERIIQVFSPVCGVVFDCFMGSGTTQAVAMELVRRFIGADINLGAIQTTTKRLIGVANELDSQILPSDAYTGFEVYNVNNYDMFRNPVEARELILQALEVAPYETSNVYDGEKDGRMIKVMPVNRIATKADLQGLIANLPYKAFEQKKEEDPNAVVLKLTLVCMGHESDLAATLKQELSEYKVDVDVVDILHDRADLQFKRDAEADVTIQNGELVIRNFYPMNLMQKLSLDKETVDEWRQLVESVMIDFNFDGTVMQPSVIDIPEKNEMVKGRYKIPQDAGKIRIKITDVLSESLEIEVQNA